ncbi:MAG TPA: enoyl-CoA hydratase/isomerase family protein [Planctomycetota bacterium]|jgi:2-(1,2-epoxy-1,2-dihydrophenyl)acetyl-CoA isomerase|nr:enoyl-CoA hydratase/isomerase family protein [Planctomycetota bacterium]
MGAIKIQVAMGGLLAKVSLSRPEKYNAFDREMLRELADIVRGVTDSAKCRVVVLTGDGKAFCAGADLHAAKSSDSLTTYVSELVKSFHYVLTTLAQSPALVVTLVNGSAAGGGFSLALAGDLRWALPEAKFRAGYGRVGLTMDGGMSWRLPRIVGFAQAQRILFEDPDIDADEAHALGIVHQVVPQSELVKNFEMLVEKSKLQSRSLFAKNRHLLLESQSRTLAEAYEAEALAMKISAGTPDGREGIEAFVAKRPPKFTS